ncbi:MAG: DNA polymerase III subunit gamma/tau, partial [Anaerolineae bacterium]
MSRRALYLKWRPGTFEEVIGQEPVTRTLRQAIDQGKISHAYLFCGPRGTGKTSTARILAKAVNCIGEGPRPCNACAICQAINDGSLMDLIEIDAASHTGVDNVRELREKVGFRPNQARYKVYIIDEVHMLSSAAFNALLKTLEEPPPHVIFVLATTEPHRVPATVISRCQRFDFRYVPASTIAAHLRQIAAAEGLHIEDEALELIAVHAAGGVRDALSLLDQLTAYGDAEIRAEHVRALLGIGSTELVARFVDALLSRDVRAGLEVIDTLVDQGVPLRQFNAELLEYLRGMLLVKAGGESRLLHMDPEASRRLAEQAKKLDLAGWARLVELFSQSAQGLKTSLQPQLPLELALVQAVSEGKGAQEPAPIRTEPAAVPAAPTAPSKAPAQAEVSEVPATPAPTSPPAADDALLQRLRAT